MNLQLVLLRSLVVVAAVALVIQLVPFGRAHANPPISAEPVWDSARTRELAQRACFDCHSNETKWPWYAHIAPMSWLVQYDVDQGRAVLNVSEWQLPQEEAPESAQTVLEGEMPLGPYVWLHPSARLSATERDTLVRGLTATFGAKSGRSSGEDDDDDG